MEPTSSGISRRAALKKAALAGGAAAAATLLPGIAAEGAQAPAIQTGTQTGRRYRAWVVRTNPRGTSIQDSNASVEQVTLKPLDDDRVVVRTEACQICYTITGQSVGNYMTPQIMGHGAVGIVEAIGSNVRRVQVGDRVMTVATPACGQCYTCLRGRADRCQFLTLPVAPIGTLSDGSNVTQHDNVCGFAELMIAPESACVPAPTMNVSPVELAMIVDVSACGLGTAFGVAPVEPASDVVVLGCGPVGLSAIQGARIKGASQIIAVDPIKARRDLAMTLGATTVLDPNVEGMNLVAKIKSLCTFPGNRQLAGGRDATPNRNNIGPDYVIEAVGGDSFPPKAEVGPDPTGILPLQQAWQLCSAAGYVTTVSVGQRGNFSVPAGQWSNGSKAHQGGNMVGVNTLRDLPRFARLIETGQFNAKALVTSTFTLDRAKEAMQTVADRATIAAVFTFA